MSTTDENQNIQIHELLQESICSICRKRMKGHRTLFIHDGGLQEIEIKTTHNKCDKLMSMRDKMSARLLDIDYELFVLRDGR